MERNRNHAESGMGGECFEICRMSLDGIRGLVAFGEMNVRRTEEVMIWRGEGWRAIRHELKGIAQPPLCRRRTAECLSTRHDDILA